MAFYLTRTEHKNHYVNIRPIFELRGDTVCELPQTSEGEFAPRGLVQINAVQHYTETPALLENQAYSIMELKDTLLNSLVEKEDGTKQMRASDFLNCAKPVDIDYKLREVLQIQDILELENVANWDPIIYPWIPISKKVYLENNEIVAGPFTWSETEIGLVFSPSIIMGELAHTVEVFERESLQEEPDIWEFDATKSNEDVDLNGYTRKILYGTTETLPKALKYVDCITDKDLKNLVSKLLAQDLETKRERNELKARIAELPNSGLTGERKNRVLEYLKNSDNIDDYLLQIPNLVLQSEDSIKKIAEAIFENENYKNSDKLTKYVQGVSGYTEELEKVKKEKKELSEKLEILKKDVNEYSSSKADIASTAAVQAMELQIEDLQRQVDDNKKVEDLNMELTSLKTKIDSESTILDHYKNELSKVANDIDKKINDAYQTLFDENFDGELANILTSSITEVQAKKNKENVRQKVVSKREKLHCSEIDNVQELIDYIYNELNSTANRNISKNDIINILICLSQGFLTVFAGEPGTGKTSLVNLIARILGLVNDEFDRFIEINVEKGWTSKKDLIGYYNPLQKKFEANNKQLFESLTYLDCEVNFSIGEEIPFMVLLDEANLSQMEYYWSDFMGICDMDRINRTIQLSENLSLNVPKTLRFIATINLDNTTEVLSPRLIDRSWIILLNTVDIDIEDIDINYEAFEQITNERSYPIVSSKVLNQLYYYEGLFEDSLNDGVVDKFSNINEAFKNRGILLSPRIVGMIKKYCLVGEKYFSYGEVTKNAYTALDYAVAQKVLPKINGYGTEYKIFIEKLIKECDEYAMPRCNSILKSILIKGDANMGYYQYFTR